MTNAASHTPINKNFLSQLNFQFNIKRAPSVNYHIQSATLPGLSLDSVETANPLVSIPHAGDHIYYEELGIQFKVDEELRNYLEIHNWIRKLGFPTGNAEYRELSEIPQWDGTGLKSDLTLMITNSLKNIRFQVIFVDAFPISLSNLQFDTTAEGVEYLEAFAAFRYTYYDILPAG